MLSRKNIMGSRSSTSAKKNRKSQGSARRSVTTDPALILRPEYPGQPVAVFRVPSTIAVSSTTVTTGQIAVNATLSSGSIPNFATRFAAFTEFRIVKVNAKWTSFGSTLPGLINWWFSEDDTAAPTTAKAQNAAARRFPACDIRTNGLSYTPHDPAQQTWALVSSGSPTIGYLKIFTNNADFGASIVATQYATLETEYIVQFRGFI